MVSPEDMSVYNESQPWCTKNMTGDIWHRYCGNSTTMEECDPYFQQQDIIYKHGMPGMFSDVASSMYLSVDILYEGYCTSDFALVNALARAYVILIVMKFRILPINY